MPTFLPSRAPAWTTTAAATKSGAALSILLATSSTQALKGSGSSSSSNSSTAGSLISRGVGFSGHAPTVSIAGDAATTSKNSSAVCPASNQSVSPKAPLDQGAREASAVQHPGIGDRGIRAQGA